jgi:hypothetical protein
MSSAQVGAVTLISSALDLMGYNADFGFQEAACSLSDDRL